MTLVALTWAVFESTRSAEVLALFGLVYTAPVLVGGFLAGSLLDRFDRRTVMLADTAFRGCVVAAIPLLHAAGELALWHLFVVAAVHGLLKMIVLAGGPSVVPVIVPREHWDAANAMETLGYTITAVLGPAIAGALIPLIGAPTVLAIDAATYAAFALALLRVPRIAPGGQGADPSVRRGYGAALSLLVRSPVLLATTLMFMTFNIGQGLLFVWLPLLVERVLAGGPELYGLLLAALAAGEVCGSVAAGTTRSRLPAGAKIGVAQALSGSAIAAMLLRLEVPAVAAAMFAFGFASAPLTIWAQTLRMAIIPDALRGRTFALLRTLMQGTLPVGAGLAGVALPMFGIPVAIALTAALVGAPGAIGLGIRALRTADPVRP